MTTICPAPAGMSPLGAVMVKRMTNLPRTCGDEPPGMPTVEVTGASAPHLRG